MRKDIFICTHAEYKLCSTKFVIAQWFKNACIACKGKPLQLMFIIPFSSSL